MRTLGAPLALVALFACGERSTSPNDPGPRSVGLRAYEGACDGFTDSGFFPRWYATVMPVPERVVLDRLTFPIGRGELNPWRSDTEIWIAVSDTNQPDANPAPAAERAFAAAGGDGSDVDMEWTFDEQITAEAGQFVIAYTGFDDYTGFPCCRDVLEPDWRAGSGPPFIWNADPDDQCGLPVQVVAYEAPDDG